MSDVILDTVQIALFPTGFKINSAYALYEKLRDILDKSDKNLKIDPLFDKGGPDDFVRLSSVLSDKNYIEVQFSPMKINFFWRNLDSVNNFSIDINEVNEVIKRVIGLIFDESIRFNRIGYISTVFKTNSEPGTLLSSTISNNLDLKLTDAQLSLTYDLDPIMKNKIDSTINYNLHVKVGSGIANKLNNERAVAIEYDLNTRQDQNLNWRLDKVLNFLSIASAHKNKDQIYGDFFKI